MGRAYFLLCRALGRVLRSTRYASVRVVREDGRWVVRKRRSFHSPLLIALGGPLVRVLSAGMRVLPQRSWAEREGALYESLYGLPLRVERDGTLVLPHLPGETLASLLEDPQVDASGKARAIERATTALADLHRRGETHADAMAENVLVDLDADVARWFDFETVHDAARPIAWRRADDLRALLATCVLRAPPQERARTLRLVLDTYGDEDTARLLQGFFASVWRRPLAFHLGQAPLSLGQWREVSHLLKQRLAEREGS